MPRALLRVLVPLLLGLSACVGTPGVVTVSPSLPQVTVGPEGKEPDRPPPPRRFTIAASGDILVHSPVAQRAAVYGLDTGRAFDFRPMFSKVKPSIARADVAICHLETPISADNSDLSSFPRFNAPTELAAGLAWAGYDGCSTASNHSYDQGTEGVNETIRALAAAGLRHEGTSRRPGPRGTILRVEGVRLGHLSYTYGLNGLVLPAGKGYLVDLLDPKAILEDARRLRGRGAEFVVLSLHWGIEHSTQPTPDQLASSRRLLRSPHIDLILGHHAHVVQPVLKVGREYAVLGMGNFLSNQRPGATSTCCLPQTQDGVLIRVKVVERGPGWRTDLTFVPTWVEPESLQILPAMAAARAGATPPWTKAQLKESTRRTTDAIEALGADLRRG